MKLRRKEKNKEADLEKEQIKEEARKNNEQKAVKDTYDWVQSLTTALMFCVWYKSSSTTVM